ncbi:MAG TPA: glycosyltransferase family 39 protein [Blastocatellia bacterium]|nr:glycosyltransferase family 39 protein [Blastocatellia bacterium]
MNTFLRKYCDFAALALVLGGFLYVATQKLATVPVPDTDESYMLQTSYEMLYRGKLALPFRRFLGGDIENNWHSFTPLHYVLQSGFLKLFGWGIPQGRAFNLTMAVLMLVMVYLIGRKLFEWRVGIIAVGLLACDLTLLERSRYLRNDYSASLFALLAYLLFEAAERRKSWRLFIGSGLAAGAAVMCHTTALYMLAAIPLLMIFKRGWRIVKSTGIYQFALGAFIASSYEIVTDILDWSNVLLQNRGDKRHFKILGAGGWWKNIQNEHLRYDHWLNGSFMYADVPRTLNHVLYYLTIAALAYLLVRAMFQFRRGDAMGEPRLRLLIVAVAAILFFAIVTSQKAVYYMAHLTPWFAIAAGIMLWDGFQWMRRTIDIRIQDPRLRKYLRTAVLVAIVLSTGLCGLLAVRQSKRYLRNVRDPDVASFDEFKTAIRSLVPEGVCPVVIREPAIWLAFPEHDRCFANIEKRMKKAVDLDAQEYALIVQPRRAEHWITKAASSHHHLLGELRDSPYGNFNVYYTGTDPRWVSLQPVRYQFFGKRRGYAKDYVNAQEQLPAPRGQ